MKKQQPVVPNFHAFAHGGDYNPEQWMDRYPGIVEEDIRLMDLAGCNTFSVGIFSWVRYEPREGVFEFAWMRAVLDRLHAAGIHIRGGFRSPRRPVLTPPFSHLTASVSFMLRYFVFCETIPS